MRGGETDIWELIAEANAAGSDRLERRINWLEDQRREIVQEYELIQDALVEELRKVRCLFRREGQEVERELVKAREALGKVEEADEQMLELVEELSS